MGWSDGIYAGFEPITRYTTHPLTLCSPPLNTLGHCDVLHNDMPGSRALIKNEVKLVNYFFLTKILSPTLIQPPLISSPRLTPKNGEVPYSLLSWVSRLDLKLRRVLSGSPPGSLVPEPGSTVVNTHRVHSFTLRNTLSLILT